MNLLQKNRFSTQNNVFVIEVADSSDFGSVHLIDELFAFLKKNGKHPRKNCTTIRRTTILCFKNYFQSPNARTTPLISKGVAEFTDKTRRY